MNLRVLTTTLSPAILMFRVDENSGGRGWKRAEVEEGVGWGDQERARRACALWVHKILFLCEMLCTSKW